ncbi:hypothetical protein [uncultured Sphingomonas sp.]
MKVLRTALAIVGAAAAGLAAAGAALISLAASTQRWPIQTPGPSC